MHVWPMTVHCALVVQPGIARSWTAWARALDATAAAKSTTTEYISAKRTMSVENVGSSGVTKHESAEKGPTKAGIKPQL